MEPTQQPDSGTQLDLESIAHRIRQTLDDLKLKATELAAATGTPYSTLRAYTSAQRPPSPEFLAALFTHYGVMPSWLLTGIAPRRLTMGSWDIESDFVLVPTYDVRASAGHGAINGLEEPTGGLCFSRNWLKKRGFNAEDLRVLGVEGESMAGKINDDDKIVVHIKDTSPRSGRAYALLQGDELLVKYCQMMPDGILRVSSENPNYPPYDIDLSKVDNVKIIGRVVSSTHDW